MLDRELTTELLISSSPPSICDRISRRASVGLAGISMGYRTLSIFHELHRDEGELEHHMKEYAASTYQYHSRGTEMPYISKASPTRQANVKHRHGHGHA
jgi:hypothetical protein